MSPLDGHPRRPVGGEKRRQPLRDGVPDLVWIGVLQGGVEPHGESRRPGAHGLEPVDTRCLLDHRRQGERRILTARPSATGTSGRRWLRPSTFTAGSMLPQGQGRRDLDAVAEVVADQGLTRFARFVTRTVWDVVPAGTGW